MRVRSLGSFNPYPCFMVQGPWLHGRRQWRRPRLPCVFSSLSNVSEGPHHSKSLSVASSHRKEKSSDQTNRNACVISEAVTWVEDEVQERNPTNGALVVAAAVEVNFVCLWLGLLRSHPRAAERRQRCVVLSRPISFLRTFTPMSPEQKKDTKEGSRKSLILPAELQKGVWVPGDPAGWS